MKIRGFRILNLFHSPFTNFYLSLSTNMEDSASICISYRFHVLPSLFSARRCSYCESTANISIVFLQVLYFHTKYHIPRSSSSLFIAFKPNVYKKFFKAFVLFCNVQKYILKTSCIFFEDHFCILFQNSQ
jgi:hypothetical protein